MSAKVLYFVNDFPDVDSAGWLVEPDASLVAADAFKILAAGEIGDDFCQMTFGNAIQPGFPMMLMSRSGCAAAYINMRNA